MPSPFPGMDPYLERNWLDVHSALIAETRRALNWSLPKGLVARALMRPFSLPPEAASAPYRAIVRVAGRRGEAHLFPILLRESLPEIPVPLRKTDTPVKLALASMLESVYADGRYEATLDYARPLEPPLEGDDARWVDALLRGKGLKTA